MLRWHSLFLTSLNLIGQTGHAKQTQVTLSSFIHYSSHSFFSSRNQQTAVALHCLQATLVLRKKSGMYDARAQSLYELHRNVHTRLSIILFLIEKTINTTNSIIYLVIY